MLGYGLIARDVPVNRLEELDELLENGALTVEDEEPASSSVDDVRAFVERFGAGEVTLVG